jgi:hypothetical protein
MLLNQEYRVKKNISCSVNRNNQREAEAYWTMKVIINNIEARGIIVIG